MKLLRLAAFVFAFLTLVGGYAWHQYLLFTDANAFAQWLPQATQYSITLGWILLILAVALSFAPAEESID